MFSKELMKFICENAKREENEIKPKKVLREKETYTTTPISYLILKCSPTR